MIVSAKGDIFEGEFANDLANGRGKLTCFDGNSYYEGEWLNCVRNGHG